MTASGPPSLLEAGGRTIIAKEDTTRLDGLRPFIAVLSLLPLRKAGLTNYCLGKAMGASSPITG